jgi:hypothetical protein
VRSLGDGGAFGEVVQELQHACSNRFGIVLYRHCCRLRQRREI